MKEFKEKWDSDPRFKVKIKLIAYSAFVLFVAALAISSKPTASSGNFLDKYNINTTTEEKTENIFQIPDKYNYIKYITINEDIYQYTGTKKPQKETISKESKRIITNYVYENNSYYKEEDGTYMLTTKEEVYDVVSYNYLNLETINEYLSKGTKEGNQYLVYLKDIILGNDSEDYIIITIDQNKINIDYTSLMKNFDNTITKYLVNIEIEELE